MSTEWNVRKDQITDYYAKLIEDYGDDPRSCDYGRKESQAKKFRILNEAMPLDGKKVLDVGCGLADFSAFLKSANKDISYDGIDITEGMITLAKKKYPNLNLRCIDILKEDITSQYDLVTANGIFYLLGENAWETMKTLIARMFTITNQAVAFNSLSLWCEDPVEGEFYADPVKTLKFCKSLTPYVTLRHDYHTRDFTIYMYKEQV